MESRISITHHVENTTPKDQESGKYSQKKEQVLRTSFFLLFIFVA